LYPVQSLAPIAAIGCTASCLAGSIEQAWPRRCDLDIMSKRLKILCLYLNIT
jgi:hypothetical protein